MDSESPITNPSTSPRASRQLPTIKTACGGTINDDPSKYPSAIFNGERVYFCVEACLKAFLNDPDKFMAGEIEHPTEENE